MAVRRNTVLPAGEMAKRCHLLWPRPLQGHYSSVRAHYTWAVLPVICGVYRLTRHAGYSYSGPCAAYAYKQVDPSIV